MTLHPTTGGIEPEPAPRAILPEPSGWTDPITGGDGPQLWERMLRGEEARIRRYGGSATIVLFEFGGFDELALWVGTEEAIESFGRLARLLLGEIRTSDQAARIGTDRLGVLLVGTDEIRTVNFVERALRALAPEIDGPRSPVRVGVGWASPGPGEGMADVVARAEQRLRADFFGTRRAGDTRRRDRSQPAMPAVSTADDTPAPMRSGPPASPVAETVTASMDAASDGSPANDPRGSAKPDRHDPWWDLEGVGARLNRRRSALMDRVAFVTALGADLAVALGWCIQLGLVPIGVHV